MPNTGPRHVGPDFVRMEIAKALGAAGTHVSYNPDGGWHGHAPPSVVNYTPGDCCAMCGRYFDACKCPAPKLVPQTPGWKCGGCNASSSVGWFRTVYGDTICTTCGWSERLQRALDQNTDLKRRIENIKSALK